MLAKNGPAVDNARLPVLNFQVVKIPGLDNSMTDQHEPAPDIHPTAVTTDKVGSPRVFGVIIILLLIIWIVVMSFRWELRAQYWAHQVAHCESLEDRDFYVTRLASIRDKSLNAVASLANDSRPEVRDAAVTILHYCESPRAADALIRMLADSNPDIVTAAATALARRRDSATYIPQLTLALLDKQGPASWGAAVTIGRIGGTEAERVLMTALARLSDPDLKAQLIDSLGLLDCRAAVPLMIDALGDDRTVHMLPQSQQSAQRAVAALTPQLIERGADPHSALQAASTAPTVAAVAAHWVRLLCNLDAQFVTTQPATRRAESIRTLKQSLSQRCSTSSAY